jgi:hypothetical protein
MPASERRRLPGIEDKRADLLHAGVTMLAAIFDVFEIGGKAKGFEFKDNMTVHVVRTPTEKKHWQRWPENVLILS